MTLDPNAAQRRAADPRATVWVAASAGTGKTKVLTDRVLTLLLAGTPSHKILCLTFTKAAAAEMATRLAEILGDWTRIDDDALDRALTDLLGRPPTPDETSRARRLFARVIDTPGGMRIETIHAFCQSVLRRFPVEAGLAPHFQVMDERAAAELMLAAREHLLTTARAGVDPALAAALSVVTGRVHESQFPDLMAALSSERGRLRRLLNRHDDGPRAAGERLRRHLGLRPDETPRSVLATACADDALDVLGLRLAASGLRQGSKADIGRGDVLAAWLAADPATRVRRFEAYKALFLTTEDAIKAQRNIVTQGAARAAPGSDTVLMAEAARVHGVVHKLRAARIAEGTDALLVLGSALLAAYERAKEARALLDYDDLILTTRDLLRQPGVAPWVLFKLDGGLDHLLVDEAQDTNPEQWEVIDLLSSDFHAGKGAAETIRTVFAVGDAKQSIYSFQRADPQGFVRKMAAYRDRVAAVGGRWDEVPLTVSFRSSRAVLAAVDAVFAADEARSGVALDGRPIHHDVWRDKAAGRVELWTPIAPRDEDPPAAWKPPLERRTGAGARTRLAALVAARIRAMLDGERLESRGRPIRPGDIMVLVPRRGGFVDDLVRELKRRDVPVAGADRMRLTEQMAVMDLMALGDFLLLPEDDLTLACLLKSPLVGLGENDLFSLAHGREGTLWDELGRRPEHAPARRLLADLLARVDFVPPFELYARLLGEGGGRRRLIARLGREADDPIDEFLNLAAAHERDHVASLQGFLHWLRAGAVEVKRDLDSESGDAVRVMTVHGAKGLQAPVVFLPDTLQTPQSRPVLLWDTADDGDLLVWSPTKGGDDPVAARRRAAVARAQEEERRRLLYVAMTRAEDRLYVCGWAGKRAPPAGCWHDLVKAGLTAAGQRAEDPFLAASPDYDGGSVWRITAPQLETPRDAIASDPPGPTRAAPDWLFASPPEEPDPPRPLVPSRPDDDPPVRAPLAGGGQAAAYRRGRLIHRLLQVLPDLPAEHRRAAARRIVDPALREFGPESPDSLIGETLAVLDHPDLAPLFGPGSRSEVPLAGRIGGRAVAARVDRLLVTDDAVLVIDYKTNRPPPRAPEDTATVYLRQMAAYRALLRAIWPDRPVRCHLLWTDGPRLMVLGDDLLDRHVP